MRTLMIAAACTTSALMATSAAAGAPAFSSEEVITTAKALSKRVRMPVDTRAEVLARLKRVLKTKRVNHIQGVMAYRIGEGGLLVKFISGHGYVRFKDEPKSYKVDLKATTFGAQIGGSSEWGFGLVNKLSAAEAFGGIYRGPSKGAVAIESGLAISRLTRRDAGDDQRNTVHLIGAAKGMSAGVATARLTIAVHR